MSDNLTMPTYYDLIELSNGDLAKYMRLAQNRLSEAKRRGESTLEKEQIYRLFEKEWAKRLELGKRLHH